MDSSLSSVSMRKRMHIIGYRDVINKYGVIFRFFSSLTKFPATDTVGITEEKTDIFL